MMNKLDKAAGYFEKLFWLFLFINPLLDIINGMYIMLVRNIGVLDVEYINTLGVTPSLVVRMIMLVFFALYILIIRDKKSILTAIPMGVAWVLSVVSEYMSLGKAEFFLDAQYMARFCFNIVVLMVYTRVFALRFGDDKDALLKKINRILALSLGVLAVFVIVPSVLGMGYSTYADRLGYRGSRGFFYAGNDITAIMSLLFPICLAAALKCNFKADRGTLILQACAIALGVNAMLIIGSKTAFLSCAATAAIMFCAAAFFALKEKKSAYIVNYIIAAAAVGVVFLILNFISGFQMASTVSESITATEVLVETEGTGSAMLHGRGSKLDEQLAMYLDGGIFVWLFGLGRGSLTTILEMDVFEVLFYYGIFGFCAMMWLYVKVALQFFIGFFKNFDVTACALFAALGLCTGYLFIAGHVLFSVTSGFYFALTIVYSRLYFAKTSGDVLLFKKKKSAVNV